MDHSLRATNVGYSHLRKSLEIHKIISGTRTYNPVPTLQALPFPWSVDFSDKCPLAQGIKARERARERLTLRQRLREAFYKSHDDFRSKCNSVGASYDLLRFGNAMSTARKVWKTGFQSLRRLLNNQLPPSVQEVFGCIQVSLAMRSTLDDLGEAKNQEAQNEFWSDLDRWSNGIPNRDKALFDEISHTVWGKPYQKDYFVKMKWSDEEGNLEHFQKIDDKFDHSNTRRLSSG